MLTRRRKSKKQRTHKKPRIYKKKYRGGFGPKADPFVGRPWSSCKNGYYYALNKCGTGVGGTEPYYMQKAGKKISSKTKSHKKRKSLGSKKQRGGGPINPLIPQPLLNMARNTIRYLGNNLPVGGKKWLGEHLKVSPDPTVQPALSKNIRLRSFSKIQETDIPKLRREAMIKVNNM